MPLLIRCRCNERFLLMKLRVGIGSARSGGAGAISRHERRTCSTTPIAQTRSGPRVPPGNLGGPRLTRLDGRVPPQMQPVLSHGFSGQSGGRLERRMLAIQCRNRQTDAYFGAARRTYPLCLTRFASWARLRFRRCVSTILERPGAEDAPPPCPIPTLYSAQGKQDDNYDKQEPKPSARIIAPPAAVSPSRQCADQQDDQDNEENGAHDVAPLQSSYFPTIQPTGGQTSSPRI